MHDIISERAQQQPEKEAISSFDGSLTYAQIDQYSTLLAGLLKTELDIKLHDFVPVCFEKSRWTVVAVLAVMKSGGTMVLMDPTLPLARLQNMAEQVGAKAMVSSRKQHDLARSILPDGKFVTVDSDTFKHLSEPQGAALLAATIPSLLQVPASALMYIIFTSGSTGTPKGVKISHQSYTSSAFPRAKAVGYTEESRVLDFASYAFDVSIDSMLLTLANGGCLCIPSDEDRLNDINAVMRDMRVNYAGITPSMARILDLDVIASLSGLGLGGEACGARDVNFWGQHTRIIIGYGPCECTIGCTVNSSAAKGRNYISIGPGNGAAMWIVDPNDHEVLMPVGAVGELLVDGPIVGQGYLNDPEKTAAAFIEDPSWLTAGHGSYTGRRGRLYKTGDLGKYDPDGSGEIVFVGRKDTQVKLRGQRVELGEIESQLRARLPADTNVIAEVIVPGGSARGQPTLVAFVASRDTAHGQDVELEYTPLGPELGTALSKADAEIAEVLPRYMVPNAYIPVNRVPTLISGKTDRKKLRQFGATVDLRQLTASQEAPASDGCDAAPEDLSRPLNESEQRLRQAWGQILKLDPAAIRLNDNFFALGGDSLAAMRLVSVCREQGLDLSVISTFGHPTLSAMAAVVASLDDSPPASETVRVPFSLISQPVESAIVETAKACGTETADIEDIYPCTPTQEALLTFSIKSTEAYIAQRVACIPPHISVDAWKQAWDEVVAATPILRSRLVQLGDHASIGQAVLRETVQWKHSAVELAHYLEQDRDDKMGLGQSLARYAIVEPPSSPGKQYMVWTLHHAVYDGWSEPIVLEKVRDALQQSSQDAAEAQQVLASSSTTTMGDFVKYVHDTDEAAMREYWRGELQGAVGPQFPRVPSRDFLPTPDGFLERHVPLPPSAIATLPFTLATLIRGAWSLVSSKYSGNADVVFGETLTGRDIPLPGVEGIVGPLIATVPIRVRVDHTRSVGAYLHEIQQGMLKRTPYQHMGMQNIRRVSRDAQYACEAPTGLVIQPEPEYGVGCALGFALGDVVREAIHFNPYPLMLACGIEKGGGFRVCASFDSGLVDEAQMGRILAQFETACVELARDLERPLGEVTCLPTEELGQIWSWNRAGPLLVDAATGGLRADTSIVKPGDMYHPRAVVPWVCDLRNPGMLSPIGCAGELWLEGSFLTGSSVVDSPPWLLAGAVEHAGRTGKVQPTGDIVKLREDGSMVFVRRKDEDMSAQGYAADMTELEMHLTKYVPSSVRAVAAGQPMVLFIEKPQALEHEPSVEIMSTQHTINVADGEPNSETTFAAALSSVIPVSLAAAVKRFDKFAQNSLASHLVPSAYIVLDKMPSDGGQTDRGFLQQLAARIPKPIADQIRIGFQEAWAKGLPAKTGMTATTAEGILRSCWADILLLGPEQIDVDDNFFRLGGDSVMAMKLVSRLRAQGHGLTVADIFRNMRLGDAARVLRLNQYAAPSESEMAKQRPSYQPFSILDAADAERFITEVVRPKLDDASWSVQDVYPVTDSQELDVRATVEPPRTSVQYTMLYSEKGGFVRARLLQACRQLVQAHDILRTVFVEHESTFLQVVLKSLEVPVVTHRAEGEDLEKSVRDLCAADADSDAFRLGSPFLRFFLIEGTEGQECLAICLSHAQYDGGSLPRLLQDLETLYAGNEIVPSEPFSSYLAQSRAPTAQAKALSYWASLLAGSSLSVLPGQFSTTQPTPSSRAIFRTSPISTTTPRDTTTATLLTAAWALVLARRLGTPDITFGSITSGRATDLLPTAESVMGPCYQFTPVRVRLQPEWTAADLMGFVQSQGAESAAYDFVGFEAIARRAGWSADLGRASFFDSVVHHQDWEDVDEMPFAGGKCKVDVVNPHGDAARPVKVVSFF
ncbi:Nonribosomal peptide synthetase 4 [Collariella sp. IMI 366227]|nr:Nonribosomal peptide synthetase 4 [Collariella sp. IMI 366227]